MDLQYLREATRLEHEATEAAMPLLGPDLTRERYAHVLRCLLPILRSWEDWCAENVPQRLRPMLEPRRRSHLLLADLHTLGGETAADPAGRSDSRDPAWTSILDMSAKQVRELASHGTAREYEAGFLGALYVLEGSTLGGRILARQVETVLELTPGQGNAYFQGHGAATGALWKEVTAEIAAVPEEMSVRLLSTARRTFTAFRQALEGGGQPAAGVAVAPASPGTAAPATAATSAMVAGTSQRNQASNIPNAHHDTVSKGTSRVAEGIAATEVHCEDELIRVPGAVQQHGFLLVTDGEFQSVLIASENAERFFHLPFRLVLGASLETLLSRELLAALRGLRYIPEAERDGLVTFLGSFRLQGEYFSVTTHCTGSERVLEFELQDQLVGPEMMNGVITNFVGTLSRLQNERELCNALTRQIADLTGFDRVLLYCFDAEGHGTVLSEINNGKLPSYLGLRFPSSDIPQQARDLYVLNTVRIIPDATYTPSPLRGLPGQDTRGFDLSLSLLRSVSPTHLEYMRNMGTQASMSVSLVTDGRLWGLVSGHHAEPHLVPYLIRSACDMLTKMASTQLSSFGTASRLQQLVQFHAVQRNILTELAAGQNHQNHLDGLTGQLAQVIQITNAAGVALVVDGDVVTHGEVPSQAAIVRLTEWLNQTQELDTFVSSHLSAELPWTDEIGSEASGLLAIRISAVQHRYLLWFRPEVVKTVRWAGEPDKIIAANQTLHPRNSFGEWKETVQGRSEQWTAVEVDSARDFRSALTTISLRRAEEAVELGEARFRQLTQALPVRVFTADDSGDLTYTNERWQNTGLSGSGRWFDERQLCPEDATLCEQLWVRAVAGNSDFEAEIRLRTPSPESPGGFSGQERWNFVRAVPFHRANAARAGWIGCFIDLTESKERETALRMNEKLALTGRMTSVIAHEINNPLEAITNLMYLLRAEVHDDGPATGYIGMVESELERISGITKQTLRWNRESADQRETFRAGEMVDDVLRLFAGKIRNRQITVKLKGDRQTQLSGVVGQLRQVLANLVANAIDAAPVGGSVSIGIMAAMDGLSRAETGFAVTDNGKGISAETQKRLFEPFYSTKGDLGNGLGLYISREIVERHGGRIMVSSVVGSGTTMRVWLPATQAAVPLST